MKYTALICARGGSKGLPGKNIKLLCGVPLIGRSIQIAKQVGRVDKIIVSTDSEAIAQVAKEYGAEVPFMRPKELAQDNSSEWDVWKHALDYLKENNLDALVSLPTTAPLRSVEDIENCLDEYEKDGVDVVITVTEAHRNPYFNMITNDDNGYWRAERQSEPSRSHKFQKTRHTTAWILCSMGHNIGSVFLFGH